MNREEERADRDGLADAVTTRLDEIRARCELATLGPWQSADDEHFYRPDALTCRTGAEALRSRILLSFNHHFPYEPDRDFIAHAREDVPWLLDMLAVSESRRRHAEQAADSYRNLADAERLLRERAESSAESERTGSSSATPERHP